LQRADAFVSIVDVQNRAALPHGVYKLSGAFSLLSEALNDPDVLIRAVCS
jgi:hypothetical protein